MYKHKNKNSFPKSKKKETMECPGVNFFSTSGKNGQFIIILYGEYTPESSVGLKVQVVLLVQGNTGG